MRPRHRATAIRGARRSLALALTAALLATSVAVPVLDRSPTGRAPAVETEHRPGTCGVAHDHQICKLSGANLWLDAGDSASPLERAEIRRTSVPVLPEPPVALTATIHHSRAPPVV